MKNILLIILLFIGLKSYSQNRVPWYFDAIHYGTVSMEDTTYLNSVIYENGVEKDTCYFSGDTLICLYENGTKTIKTLDTIGAGLDEIALETYLTDSSYLRMQDTVETIYTHYKGDSLATQLRSEFPPINSSGQLTVDLDLNGNDINNITYLTIGNGLIMPSGDTSQFYTNATGDSVWSVFNGDTSLIFPQGTLRQTISFTTSIPFTHFGTTIENLQLSQDTTFTINSTGALDDAFASIKVVGDGSSSVTFTGFNKIGSNTFDNTTDMVNVISFSRIDSLYFYAILYQFIDDNTAPTFSGSEQVTNIADVTADFEAQINEAGTIYWTVLADGAGAPSKSAIVAGTSAIDFGSVVTVGSITEIENITGLSATTAYDLYYYAEDDESTPNETSVQTKIDFTTIASLTQLDPPTNLQAIAINTDSIILTWTGVANEDSYSIERSLDGTTGWTEVLTPVADASSDTNASLSTGTMYYYRIKAVGDGITYSDSPYSNIDRYATWGNWTAFDGSGDLYRWGDILDTLFTKADAYFELEFKIKGWTIDVNYRRLICKSEKAVTAAETMLATYLNSTNDIVIFFVGDDGNPRSTTFQTNLTSNDSVTIRITYDGTGLTYQDRWDLYVDGTEITDESTGSIAGNIDLQDSPHQLSFGATGVNSDDSYVNTNMFDGSVRDIIIRNRIDAADDYNDYPEVLWCPEQTDLSGNGFDATHVQD